MSSPKSATACYRYMCTRHTTLAIVVDLSKPSEIWFTLETLLAAAKARIENILAEMKQENPGLKEKLRRKAWERVGEEHSVRRTLCICEI